MKKADLEPLSSRTRTLKKSQNAHKKLDQLLKRQGIRGLDPDSPSGKYVHRMFRTILSAVNPTIPAAFAEMLAETMIQSIIGQRSAFEFIIEQRAPSMEISEDGKVQRAAWQQAMSAWKGFSDVMMRCMRELRPEDPAGNKELGVEDIFKMMSESVKAEGPMEEIPPEVRELMLELTMDESGEPEDHESTGPLEDIELE